MDYYINLLIYIVRPTFCMFYIRNFNLTIKFCVKYVKMVLLFTCAMIQGC